MRSLGRVGRAERFAGDDGEELWRVPADDEATARGLLALGADGVGGFEARGARDDGAVWLARRTGACLESTTRGEPRAWRDALAMVRDVARALAACERRGLFPGPLTPAEIAIDARGAFLLAEPLVAARVGGGDVRALRHGSGAPMWTPPAQLAGAPWDAAANLHVLGLVAYRAIAGEHPFAGAGLRHAVAAQSEGGAPPPFPDAVARAAKPGVQSFVLSMLDARASGRPRDAAEVAARCDALLADDTPASARPISTRPPLAAASERPKATASGVAKRSARLLWIPPLAGVLLGAALAAAAHERAPDAPIARAKTPAHAEARLEGTRAADCAPCHARQVAEWERSVMAHATKSPMVEALEILVEEQVGRAASCPNGAGVLRRAGGDVCKEDTSGLPITASGGEHWCVNCHAPGENLSAAMPPWSAGGDARARAPLRDLLPAGSQEGISCAACHATIGPVAAHAAARRGGYEGNATWTSFLTGATFSARPEDARGRTGIGNSGYRVDPGVFFARASAGARGLVHADPSPETDHYLRSSEFCGACHDVRLFGTDVVGVAERGEHFKRLRDAYSEWRAWSEKETRAGRTPATCQGCHMSLYPGVCADGEGDARGCPPGTHFEPRAPGDFARTFAAPSSARADAAGSHWFTSVDIPLTPEYPDAFADDDALDPDGVPMGLRARRDMLLARTFRFELGAPRRAGGRLEIPIVIENTGAGHKVPAGFSQEREFWVELRVTDARGALVYEVGALRRPDEDLRDKTFLRVSTSDAETDFRGRPLGVFGADVADGPDVPQWSPPPGTPGATRFRGKGLVNLQNGFLRCVRCIGIIDAQGACQPANEEQARTRAGRFADGAYDLDTGECRSNLTNGHELFETYFPVGALDAERGIAKAPDAIQDRRSAPPGVPLEYDYVIDAGAHPGPFTIEAKLRFRAFPPYLVRAFAAYEADRAARGARPSGALMTASMLRRIEPVDLASARAVGP